MTEHIPEMDVLENQVRALLKTVSLPNLHQAYSCLIKLEQGFLFRPKDQSFNVFFVLKLVTRKKPSSDIPHS